MIECKLQAHGGNETKSKLGLSTAGRALNRNLVGNGKISSALFLVTRSFSFLFFSFFFFLFFFSFSTCSAGALVPFVRLYALDK